MASVMQVYVQDANHSTLLVSVFGHLPLIGPDARRFVRWLGKAVPYRASVRIQSTWPHRLAPALEPTLMAAKSWSATADTYIALVDESRLCTLH
jgi:hypothetical protein